MGILSGLCRGRTFLGDPRRIFLKSISTHLRLIVDIQQENGAAKDPAGRSGLFQRWDVPGFRTAAFPPRS